jgi:hypothetical protein
MGVLHIYSSGRFSGRWKARKRFFLKKKQKLWRGYRGLPGDSRARVFWFFFQKRTPFFPRPPQRPIDRNGQQCYKP